MILVLIILFINIFTLVEIRKHYDLFYTSVYKQILIDYESSRKTNNSTAFLIDSHEKITNYYLTKLKIDAKLINYNDTFNNLKEFKLFLKEDLKDTEKLYFGCISSSLPNIIPLILDYFPKIEIQKNYIGGTTYLFSKETNETRKNIDHQNFDTPFFKNWKGIDTLSILSLKNDSNNKFYFLQNEIEWGPSFTSRLDKIIENNFIDISVKVKANTASDDVVLVGSLDSNEENIYWGGTSLKDFKTIDEKQSEWITIHHTIKLSYIKLDHDDIILKTYVWNKGKKDIFIDDFKIYLRKGNPIIYGLLKKI